MTLYVLRRPVKDFAMYKAYKNLNAHEKNKQVMNEKSFSS